MQNYKASDGITLSAEEIADRVAPFGLKVAWFLKTGYKPHLYQLLFHTMRNGDVLTRFRHLVAGRRGGKTLSAAWEVLFYLLHPEQFHLDAHGVESSRPLWVWMVAENNKLGLPALMVFRMILADAGLVAGKDYREHKGDRYFEFSNGSRIDFKSADEPDSLRGAGLDILWIDEAAFLRTRDAWDVTRPSLSDKKGVLITTTTPVGKNWFHQEFWSDTAVVDPNQGRVEYTTRDNPHIDLAEVDYAERTLHPMIFRREYLASFDAMAGKELDGDWLHYYHPHDEDYIADKEGMKVYVAVDPAISMSAQADRFAICALGISKDNRQAYILDLWAGKIPFPDQIDKIKEWFLRWRPMLIGIESVAYQAALAQQSERMEGLPPIIPMFAKGKKLERILAMAPLFKIGRVKLQADCHDFINEWIDYDPEQRNPNDDCLDCVEIALRTAGILLPEFKESSTEFDFDAPITSLQDLAHRDMMLMGTDEDAHYDPHLGCEI